MLVSAVDHYRRQQRLTVAGLQAARRAWPQGSASVARVVTAYQLLAARDAVESVPPMLAEQGLPAEPVAPVVYAALAGIASDGLPLDTLFDQAESALQFALMVTTQLQDVARTAAALEVAVQPAVDGYTRMVNPPSCSRCVVLAGRVYKWNDGFDRHPKCDCRHIPTGDEQMAQELGLIADPQEYFDSLSAEEQDRIFTKAGAQAIRDGADIGQVVNARRGMTTAARGVSKRRILTPEQVGGRDVFITREGTTRRGIASRQRTGRNMSARLMPETIYEVSDDRDEVLRLLQLHGYIL